MSATANPSQRWSNIGSSTMAGTATSYHSVTASPSHFISVSHTKLHSLTTDLLYPTPSVPAAPKDSSELLRRSLLISNAMTAAKKQIKVERHNAYDEARYNKRNTSSRGHLRGSARSASSSSHPMSSSTSQTNIASQASVSTHGQIYEPTRADSIEAEEGEEWFEETWRELMHEDERNSALFGSSGSTTISVRSEYQEFSSTHGSEYVYYTKADATKTETDVQVLPVESDEDSSDSSRSTSPVSSESVQPEAELIAIFYTQPVILPSAMLGISTPAVENGDVPDWSLDGHGEYEHVDEGSARLIRSDSSSSPRKPRLLPTIIRDKFYEPSRFESVVEEEDPALLALSVLPPTPPLDDYVSFDASNPDVIYSSSPSNSIVSDSDDDEDTDNLRTPEEASSNEFGYSSGNGSFDEVSSLSFDEVHDVEGYFTSGYRSTSKYPYGTSDADWENMGSEIPLFP